MRYAFFSDIHSNLQALESVARRMDRLEIDRRICLGDVVGYGGNPNECTEAVRRLADRTIAGNHDHAALEITDTSYFNVNARTAARWTRDVLDEGNREFLAGLPLVITEGEIFCVHGSPEEPDRWHYILSAEQGEVNFRHFGERLCVVGHSHRPLEAVERGAEPCKVNVLTQTRLEDGVRYILNDGSVGQPRDNDPRAGFLVLDTDEETATIERVEYDIGAAQRAILKAGLPPALAERLEHGI